MIISRIYLSLSIYNVIYIYYSYISTYIPFYRIQFLYISRYFNHFFPYSIVIISRIYLSLSIYNVIYIYYSYISTYIPFYRIQFLYISRYFNQYIPYIFAQLDLARFARLFPRDPSTWRGIPSAPRCAWRWLGRWRHWRNVEGKTLGSMGISQIVLISSALPRTNQPSLDVDLGTSKH